MVLDDDLFELGLHVGENWFKSGVKGWLKNCFACHFVTFFKVAVTNNGRSHFIGHFSGSLIATPSMNTSPSTENPQQVLKIEIFVQYLRNDIHRHLQILEALNADCSTCATCPNIIVIVHINIEDHFFVCWHKCFFVACVMTIGRNVVHCAHIDLVRNSVYQCFLETICILETQIAAIYIICQCKRELSLMEVLRCDSLF